MAAARIEFEPFIEEGARQFIVNGVDYYNIAATGLPDYFSVNFVLRGEHGDVLGGVLGQIWGHWLQVTYLWVAEAARGARRGTRNAAHGECGGLRPLAGCRRSDGRDPQFPGAAILRAPRLRGVWHARWLCTRAHQVFLEKGVGVEASRATRPR